MENPKTLQFFLNTQFIDSGNFIDLISIGVECSNGNSFYAISSEFNPRNADEWVLENVLKELPSIHIFDDQPYGDLLLSDARWQPEIVLHDSPQDEELFTCPWKFRDRIAFELTHFLKKGECRKASGFESLEKVAIANAEPDHDIEIWSYYADYHWVAFCQLFGKMIDLPFGIPHHCLDVKQYAVRLGNPDLPSSLALGNTPLSALEKASNIADDYHWLTTLSQDSVIAC